MTWILFRSPAFRALDPALQASTAARARVLVVIVAVSVLCACTPSPDSIANGDDPIAALRVSAQTTRYTTAYWHGQASLAPARWRQAVDYCRTPGIVADGSKPNCGFVQLAANQLQIDSLHARGVQMESPKSQVDRNLFKP